MNNKHEEMLSNFDHIKLAIIDIFNKFEKSFTRTYDEEIDTKEALYKAGKILGFVRVWEIPLRSKVNELFEKNNSLETNLKENLSSILYSIDLIRRYLEDKDLFSWCPNWWTVKLTNLVYNEPRNEVHYKEHRYYIPTYTTYYVPERTIISRNSRLYSI